MMLFRLYRIRHRETGLYLDKAAKSRTLNSMNGFSVSGSLYRKAGVTYLLKQLSSQVRSTLVVEGYSLSLDTSTQGQFWPNEEAK